MKSKTDNEIISSIVYHFLDNKDKIQVSKDADSIFIDKNNKQLCVTMDYSMSNMFFRVAMTHSATGNTSMISLAPDKYIEGENELIKLYKEKIKEQREEIVTQILEEFKL